MSFNSGNATAGMNRVARIAPLRIGAYLGRSTESANAAVVATSSEIAHDPAARNTVFRK
jgi:hypothetical protein